MLQFIDSFDHYQALTQKYDAVQTTNGGFSGSYPKILANSGRGGGGCVKFLTSSNIGASYVQKNFSNIATIFCGFAIWVNENSNVNDGIVFTWLDGGSVQVDLRLTSTGHFYFTRNGTTLGSQSTNALSFQVWHYVEIKVTINSTTGVAQLNIDGTNTGWINLSGQNTQATGNAQTNGFRVGWQSNTSSGVAVVNMLVDDLYLADTTGSFNTSFLGDVKVQGVLPTANGSSLQYTLNTVAWVASTVTAIGHTIKDSNGNLQVVTSVTSDAKTGTLAPTWNVSTGGTTTDNHVTWTNLGADTYWLEVKQNPPEGSAGWYQATAYTVGTAVWDTNNNLQLCTTAGSSGNANPTWNLVVGGTTSDNSVVWTNLGLGEDTFLSDATVGHITRFTFPSIVATSVFGVSVTMRARKDDAAVRSIRGDTKSGATVADSGTDLIMSTSYQMVQGIFESDPNTGVAWTQSGVNSAEFGVKTTA